MRLLYLDSNSTFRLTDDLDDDDVPRYAILSHTWGADQDEVTFGDIHSGGTQGKSGYAKLEFCGERAKKDGMDYFWIDTCCINRSSDSELSQAIRSMFRWYRNAVKCYVFLADVSSAKRNINDDTECTWEKSFRTSRWFTRGWTLQELLAPQDVEFFSREGRLLGHKATLMQQIHEITGIPVAALRSKSSLGSKPVEDFGIEERFRWAEHRKTKKSEDKAYCLFGIFDVQLPVLYGEGQEKALRRLRREIGVTIAQIDQVIQKRYSGGRLNIERLSGDYLPLEQCFVNLCVVNHVRDSNARSTSNGSNPVTGSEGSSAFSLAARLNIESPSQAAETSLNALFEPRVLKDGTVARPKRALIWGRAGMGKTTLCKKIVYEVTENKMWTSLYDRVIWLPLRRLRKSGCRDIVELVHNEFSCKGLGGQIWEVLNKLVHDERTLFLLDGLDEVSFALDHDSPAGDVLRDLLGRSNVIITSRPHSTRLLDHSQPDIELETIGFNSRQIEEYLKRAASKTESDEIRAFIARHPVIRSLAAIPIQLDAICYTWNAKDFREDNITMTSLYSMISKTLWKDNILRLGKKHDGAPITKQSLDVFSQIETFVEAEIDFLRELGFRGLYEEVIEFDQKDFRTLVASRAVSGDVPVHLSFLRTSDSSMDASDRTLHFIHLTFQEFFAAQYFVSHLISGRALPVYERLRRSGLASQLTSCIVPEDFIRSNKYVVRYNIFWRFVTGLLQYQGERSHLHHFLQTLDSEPKDLIGLTHQQLSLDCLSEFCTVNEELARKLENRLLQWISCEFDLHRKCDQDRLYWNLIHDAECSDYILLALLRDEETEDKVLCRLVSYSNVSSEILDMVIQKLTVSTNETARSYAIRVIGRHCYDDQMERFTQWFRDVQSSKPMSLEVLSALQGSRLLSATMLGFLVAFLQNPDDEIQEMAAKLLSRTASIGDSTRDALIRISQDEAQHHRSWAAYTLRRRTGLSDDVINTFIMLLHNPNNRVRLGARHALMRCKEMSDAVLDTFVRIPLVPREKTGVSAVSPWQLPYRTPIATPNACTLPSDTGLDVLPMVNACIELLEDSNGAFRNGAAYILSKHISFVDATFSAFTRLLCCPDSYMSGLAARCLAQQHSLSNGEISVLVGLLEKADEDLRGSVLLILSRQESLPEMAIAALLDILQDSRPASRICAAEAIHHQTNLSYNAMDVLGELPEDKSQDFTLVLRALGRQTNLPSTAVDALYSMLQEKNEKIQCDILGALSTQSDFASRATDTIIRLHSHSDLHIRCMSLTSLQQHNDLPDKVIDSLMRLLIYEEVKIICEWVREILLKQTSLPTTVIDMVIVKLQDPSDCIYDRVGPLISERPELSFLIPTLNSAALQWLIKHWFLTSTLCFILENHLFIGPPGSGQKVPLTPEQSERLEYEFSVAREALGMPALSPVI